MTLILIFIIPSITFQLPYKIKDLTSLIDLHTQTFTKIRDMGERTVPINMHRHF